MSEYTSEQPVMAKKDRTIVEMVTSTRELLTECINTLVVVSNGIKISNEERREAKNMSCLFDDVQETEYLAETNLMLAKYVKEMLGL